MESTHIESPHHPLAKKAEFLQNGSQYTTSLPRGKCRFLQLSIQNLKGEIQNPYKSAFGIPYPQNVQCRINANQAMNMQKSAFINWQKMQFHAKTLKIRAGRLLTKSSKFRIPKFKITKKLPPPSFCGFKQSIP